MAAPLPAHPQQQSMKTDDRQGTSAPRCGAPALTCTGLLHPPVWEELAPAGLRRRGAPLDHPHVVIHGRLREESAAVTGLLVLTRPTPSPPLHKRKGRPKTINPPG